MFPAAHSFFGVVTHTYLASTSSGLNVVATSRPNIGLKVATLRPMFRFGKVTHTYLASKSPGLNVAWPQRRLASMSPGLNVAWPQCRGLNVAGLNVAWPQCPIVTYFNYNHNHPHPHPVDHQLWDKFENKKTVSEIHSLAYWRRISNSDQSWVFQLGLTMRWDFHSTFY